MSEMEVTAIVAPIIAAQSASVLVRESILVVIRDAGISPRNGFAG